jgi:hypothetical protein
MKLILLLLLVSCAKVKLSDSEHQINAKVETESYIIVQLDFIKDIQQLCTDLYPAYENENEPLRKKLIAECTLDKMDILDLSLITDYQNSICDNPVTDQEKQICQVLSGTETFEQNL